MHGSHILFLEHWPCVQSTLAYASSSRLGHTGTAHDKAAEMSAKLWRFNITFRHEWEVGTGRLIGVERGVRELGLPVCKGERSEP